MLNTDSLAATLDAVNQALFFGTKISSRDRSAVSKWLAERCGQPGSYEFMPAPTALDFASKPLLFTGEPLTTRAGTACKLGNEGCRALIVLGVKTAAVSTALELAKARMNARLDEVTSGRAGFYCCGSCTVALWRHLLAGGLDHQEERLANGLGLLHTARQANSGWRVFPWWYTVWTLLDVDITAAKVELQYAAPKLERYLTRKPRADDPYKLRRTEIARRALALA